MSQPHRSIKLSSVGIILLGLFASIYLIIRKLFTKSDAANVIKHHTVDTPADDALTYWTADKMRHAKSADLPKVDTLDEGKPHLRRPPQTPHPHQA
jgi:hypothetical protein